jgi:hypothetical protein
MEVGTPPPSGAPPSGVGLSSGHPLQALLASTLARQVLGCMRAGGGLVE